MTSLSPLDTSGETRETSHETSQELSRDTNASSQSVPVISRDTDVPYRVSTPVGWLGKIRGLEASMHAGSVPKPIFGTQFVVQVPAESVGVPMLEVERTGLSTAPPTWTALPQWSMHRLFKDGKEAKLAENFQYNSNLTGIKRSPLFVGPGLRYMPGEHDKNSNIYRTVVLEGLPPWVTIHEVLSRVEGGKIESVVLADTTTIMGGYPTMMIRFVLQSGAQEFLRRTHGALFLGYWPTQVRQVGTPTYILSEEMDKHINQWGRTRCLKVHSEHLELRGYLRQVLYEPDWAEWIEFTQENVLAGTSILHFTSIKMAIVAYDILRSTQQFSPADLEFCHDPCAV
ncbi:hypothetical protein N7481_004826 [Penicillium waksmanii]|uniref:uncharacterized protein n=1 Tax=Penicillium waksmanii TaxID=69791 RepID=UPI002547B635|nr:uncharacterized protein N7481_004826 [Penicillium waksmanii]KAJ5989616.1 hypothetical protein N7481_004826 [Penicillium waksmanii]